jgi:hypothetical protein
VDYPWVANTCAIRLSRSFNYAGVPIPTRRRGLNTISGADGLRYAYRVLEFGDHWLRREYGEPSLSHINDREGGPLPEGFRGTPGIIQFLVPSWTSATGHLDLWDGQECAGHAYWTLAKEIHLWGVDAPYVSGSVGLRGRNAVEDVTQVQELLEARGFDVGLVDGVCGGRTRAAIRAFQSSFQARPDARLDPDGATWRRLTA